MLKKPHFPLQKILCRLPDRTLGLLSRPEQGKLPDLLQHRHYCEVLQRAICTALASVNLEDNSQPTPKTHLPILFSCVISTHPCHQLTHHFWSFIVAFSLSSSTNAALISSIISSLDSTATEKVSTEQKLFCPEVTPENEGSFIWHQIKTAIWPTNQSHWSPSDNRHQV